MSKNCQKLDIFFKKIDKIVIFFNKIAIGNFVEKNDNFNNFVNFFEKNVKFLQFFDIQMAIFPEDQPQTLFY